MSARRKAAEVKIDRALEHLQQAQNHLDWAITELSSLSFGAAAMNGCVRIRNKVNESWHSLNGKNEKLLLDHEPDAEELEKLEAMPARAHVAAKVCGLELVRSSLQRASAKECGASYRRDGSVERCVLPSGHDEKDGPHHESETFAWSGRS